jgi:hypothetical protein
MSNFLLAYDNVIEFCTVTASNSWVSTLPLNNVKTNDLSEKARSVNDSFFTITCDFTAIEDKAIGAVSLIEHNLSSNAKLTIRGYKGGTLVYSSPNTYAWPYLSEQNSFWSTYAFNVQPISGSRKDNERSVFIHLLPTNLAIDKIEIDVDDTSNPDTFIQLGRIFIGTLFKPSRNANFGEVSVSVIDNSEVQLTRAKSKRFNLLRKQRSVNIVWSTVTREDALTEIYTIQRYSGNTKEILFAEGYPVEDTLSGDIIYDSDWFSLAFIANATELNALNYVNVNLYSNGFRLDEII